MIETYNNILIELKGKTQRINYLNEKREELYARFFRVTATIENTGTKSADNDKMTSYLIELERKGYEKEIKKLMEEINKLQDELINAGKTLKSLKGLKNELYYEIVVNGLRPSQAVSKVAENNNKCNMTLWREYREIKNKIKC